MITLLSYLVASTLVIWGVVKENRTIVGAGGILWLLIAVGVFYFQRQGIYILF